MKWLEKALDEKVPGWRKQTKCSFCKKSLKQGEIARHLKVKHGIVWAIVNPEVRS